MKNLVLVGFMGSGKTAIGKRVAEKLGLTFVDMDGEIERKAGRKIADIFAHEGESYFRFLERREATELAGKHDRVIATGGLAEMISRHTPVVEAVDPFLTLRGIEIIMRRQQQH